MQSRFHNMHSRFVGFMIRHPVGVVLTAVLGAVISLLYTATHLEFDSNRLDLVSAGEHYTQLDAAFSREFEDLPGSMVVVIQSQHPDRAKAFATALAQRWQTDPHIAKVFYRLNVDALKRKDLLYLSPDELTDLRQQLQEHHAVLQELAASPTLQNLFALVNQEVTKSLVSHLFTDFLREDTQQEKPPDLSLLLALLQQMDEWLQGSRSYQSPWTRALTENAEAFSQDGFLWSDDQQLLFASSSRRHRFRMSVDSERPSSGFKRTYGRSTKPIRRQPWGSPGRPCWILTRWSRLGGIPRSPV
jgi:hypothetical protein